MRIRITDLTDDTTYIANNREECRFEMDKSGYDEAVRLNDVVCMGKTIFEPIQ